MQALSIVLFLFLTTQALFSSAELEQKKVVFVDRSPTNFLFRGNQPKTTVNGQTIFSYDLLKLYMNNSLVGTGYTLPTDFYLIDIKYVYDPNDPIERGDVMLDKNFFAQNPTLGEARIEELFGDFSDPNLEKPAVRDPKAVNLSSWQHDNLPVRIPNMHQLLYTPASKPVVIYFHCECGCDRTGEIGASYAMKYLNMTYKQAIQWDDKIAGRPILPNHQWAAAWYCWYLSLVENMNVQC